MKRLILILTVGLLTAGCGGYKTAQSGQAPRSTAPTGHESDPASSVESPSPAGPSSAATTPTYVPTARQVLGRWRVVSVNGDAPPRSSVRGLTMARQGARYYAGWSDGVNDHFQYWVLTANGEYRAGESGSSLVGCIGKPCERPSGFGVEHAASLRLDASGHLLFIAPSGRVLAAYERPRARRGGHGLSRAELSLATRIAKHRQREVTGTFIGATAFATHGTPFDRGSACDTDRRYVNVRLVWKADANFVHGGVAGAPPDGPRKAALITVDAKTGHICESGAMYAHVGAAPYETLLYGQWPDPADG